jgi:hypothetical protein
MNDDRQLRQHRLRDLPSPLHAAGIVAEGACAWELSDDADDPPEPAEDCILIVRVPVALRG